MAPKIQKQTQRAADMNDSRTQPWRKIQKLDKRRPEDLEDVETSKRFVVTDDIRILDERFMSKS
jgi:hypothetical protein